MSLHAVGWAIFDQQVAEDKVSSQKDEWEFTTHVKNTWSAKPAVQY